MIELFSDWNLEGEIIGFVARAKIPIWVLGWMRFLEVKILLLLLPVSNFFCSFIRNFLSEPVMWCRVSFFIYNKEGIKKCLAFTRPWSTFWSHQSSFMLQIPTFLFTFLHHTQSVFRASPQPQLFILKICLICLLWQIMTSCLAQHRWDIEI